MNTFLPAALLLLATPAFCQSATLTPSTPIALSSGAGGFDYMIVDPGSNRLYASHPGAKTLAVLRLKHQRASEIDLGAEVNGVAFDEQDSKFFAGGGGQKVFVFDRKTLKQEDVIDLDGPGDDILYDPDNDTLYVDNDESTHVWAIDAKTDKITATIRVDGAPEFMQYDPTTKRLYQNIKPANEVQVIDTVSNKVIATWPTAPATSPHGLVFDPVSNRLYSAGKNDTLAAIDASTGKVVGTVQLASAVDQIAFDSKLRRIYCPGGGFLTVVSISDDGTAKAIDKLTIAKKAHTIAVDPKTDTVWIAYPDGVQSYFQAFTPQITSLASAN